MSLLMKNQFYLNLTGWREDSRAFTFEFNQRGHQRYVIGEVNAADGSIRHLVDEQTKDILSIIITTIGMTWMTEKSCFGFPNGTDGVIFT